MDNFVLKMFYFSPIDFCRVHFWTTFLTTFLPLLKRSCPLGGDEEKVIENICATCSGLPSGAAIADESIRTTNANG